MKRVQGPKKKKQSANKERQSSNLERTRNQNAKRRDWRHEELKGDSIQTPTTN